MNINNLTPNPNENKVLTDAKDLVDKTVEAGKEIKKEAKDQWDDLANKASDVSKNIKDEAKTTWNIAKDKLSDVKEQITGEKTQLVSEAKKVCSNSYNKTKESLNKCQHDVSGYIKDNPFKAAGIAVAAGVIGTMILGKKKRHHHH